MRLNPKVFEDAAAKIIEKRERFCSRAIRASSYWIKSMAYVWVFRKYFKPEGKSKNEPWWGGSLPWDDCKKGREPRALALLLMAEIVRNKNK